jgi:hypothetical protein
MKTRPHRGRLGDGYVAAAFGQEQEAVGGQRGVVDDLAVGDHFLELLARHPFGPDAVFLGLGVRFALGQVRGEEIVAVLGCHAVARGQRAEMGQAVGAQPGFLGEFQPGKLLGGAGLAVREAALRE